MPSIYGDILLHFNEQEQPVQYYNMSPKVNSGFDIITVPVIVDVILHNLSGDEVKLIMETLGFAASFDVWSRTELNDAWFIKPANGNTYRLCRSKDWNLYGGFFVYNAEKVIGDDGQLTNDVSPDTGLGKFI
jgi:hypothetical protein